MATAFTLAATTAEQQVFEAVNRLRAAIVAYNAANPTAPATGLSASVAYNVQASTYSLAVTGPLTQAIATDGGVDMDATEVMTIS